jgi:hypothetical protein
VPGAGQGAQARLKNRTPRGNSRRESSDLMNW